MADISKLIPGQVLYTVTRHPLGNTTIRTVSVHAVRVVEVSDDKRSVVASWNGNASRTFYVYDVAKWRVRKPILVSCGLGAKRLATRAESAITNKQKEPT